ncbi:hypothetical protein QJQ45_001050 [Haematococcus lacustris]|nr:hypothetical protein QJQ45_001050 [Haematococcus lacustris]
MILLGATGVCAWKDSSLRTLFGISSSSADARAAYVAAQSTHRAELVSDAKAKALIKRYTSRPYLQLVHDAASAKEAWASLESEFTQVSVARQTQLQQRLSLLRMQPDETVANFFSRIYQLKSDLEACNCSISESNIVLTVIANLTSDYKPSAQQLRYEQTGPTGLTLSRVKRVMQFREADLLLEQQQEHASSPSSLFAFSSSSSRGPGSSGGGGGRGRGRSLGPRQPSPTRSSEHGSSSSRQNQHADALCYYCNKTGHIMAECFTFDKHIRQRLAGQRVSSVRSPSPGRGSSPARGASPARGGSPRRTSVPPRGRAQTPGRPAAVDPSDTYDLFTANAEDDYLVPLQTYNTDLYEPFYIDSGASQHMITDREHFSSYTAFRPDEHKAVRLAADGHVIYAVGQGTVWLNTQRGPWQLSKALHVPASRHSFISVSAATDDGASFTFTDDQCIIRDTRLRVKARKFKSSYILAAVPLPADPYGMQQPHLHSYSAAAPCSSYSTAATQTDVPVPGVSSAAMPEAAQPAPTEFSTTSAQVWHQRLCHASYSSLALMQERGMVTGVDVTASQFRAAAKCPGPVCIGCIKGKHHRNVAFAQPSSNAAPVTAPLGLVHMDVCGPISPPARDGSLYLATFLDDFTRLSVVMPMRSKAQVPSIVKQVIEQLETQSGQRCKAIRTDNGTEYVNKQMQQYCSDKGIIHQHSAPYSPEQNGAAERLNRTIMEKARSILHAGRMGLHHWADAAKLSNYVRCVLPVSDQPLTPWESFFGVKPDLSGLRVFGSAVWVHVPAHKRSKLEAKAVWGVFVGYQLGSKSYRVLVNGKEYHSKDVVFDEQLIQHMPTGPATQLQFPGAPKASALPTHLGLLVPPVPPGGDTGQQQQQQQQQQQPSSSDSRDSGSSSDNASSSDSDDGSSRAPARQRPLSQPSGIGRNRIPHADPSQSQAAIGAPAVSPQHRSASRPALAPLPRAQVAPPAHIPNDQLQGAPLPAAIVAPGAPMPRRNPHRERRPPAKIRQPELYAMNVTDSQANDNPTVAEALSGPQADMWLQAMHAELASLHENQTWCLVDKPAGARVLPTKWVLKIKRDAAGAIEKFKARLVAKGYMQVSGVDVGDVYAPVSKHTTLRTLLAKAAAEDMEVHQVDVDAAFLNGQLEPNEIIYVQQPEGFVEGSHNIVCKLQKALYGLRQAPRAWHARLKQVLEGMGFRASESDPALFTMQRQAGMVYLLVYVDDCLICTEKGDTDSLDYVKQQLSAVFGIKNLGDTKWFLGMKVTRDRALGTLKLDQQQYVHELLNTYGMTAAHSKSVPMAPAVKLEKEGVALDTSEHSYSGLVGSLLYLSCCTRPDITYAVGALARYMSAPTQQHWTAARAILSYLKGTADQGLVFGEAAELQGYCDADYAGDKDTARSTTGYVFAMNGAAISWSSRLQPTVAMSTAEAEYMAASSAVKEGLWLRKLMQDLQLPGDCTSILCDNQAALQLLHNPIASARAKHINVHHHFARERVARGEVSFSYCSTASMVADIMTKPLSLVKFSQGKQGMTELNMTIIVTCATLCGTQNAVLAVETQKVTALTLQNNKYISKARSSIRNTIKEFSQKFRRLNCVWYSAPPGYRSCDHYSLFGPDIDKGAAMHPTFVNDLGLLFTTITSESPEGWKAVTNALQGLWQVLDKLKLANLQPKVGVSDCSSYSFLACGTY